MGCAWRAPPAPLAAGTGAGTGGTEPRRRHAPLLRGDFLHLRAATRGRGCREYARAVGSGRAGSARPEGPSMVLGDPLETSARRAGPPVHGCAEGGGSRGAERAALRRVVSVCLRLKQRRGHRPAALSPTTDPAVRLGPTCRGGGPCLMRSRVMRGARCGDGEMLMDHTVKPFATATVTTTARWDHGRRWARAQSPSRPWSRRPGLGWWWECTRQGRGGAGRCNGPGLNYSASRR